MVAIGVDSALAFQCTTKVRVLSRARLVSVGLPYISIIGTVSFINGWGVGVFAFVVVTVATIAFMLARRGWLHATSHDAQVVVVGETLTFHGCDKGRANSITIHRDRMGAAYWLPRSNGSGAVHIVDSAS